jgi:hypothetical protein
MWKCCPSTTSSGGSTGSPPDHLSHVVPGPPTLVGPTSRTTLCKDHFPREHPHNSALRTRAPLRAPSVQERRTPGLAPRRASPVTGKRLATRVAMVAYRAGTDSSLVPNRATQLPSNFRLIPTRQQARQCCRACCAFKSPNHHCTEMLGMKSVTTMTGIRCSSLSWWEQK